MIKTIYFFTFFVLFVGMHTYLLVCFACRGYLCQSIFCQWIDDERWPGVLAVVSFNKKRAKLKMYANDFEFAKEKLSITSSL